MQQTAADNLNEARLIVAELTPGHLQSRSLAEALERLAAAMSQESGLSVRTTVIGEPVAHGGNIDVAVLRAAQEALANVRKHAEATTATIELSYGDAVTLTVRDNGTGFQPETATGGFGLDGLRSRAELLGGVATIASAPGEGTIVVVHLPLAPSPDPAEEQPPALAPAGPSGARS